MREGDILVADRLLGVILVDAGGTGQTLLSGTYNGHGFVDVVCDANGTIYAISDGASPPAAVVRIDRSTGMQTVLSAGGALVNPFSMQIGPDGNLLVCDNNAYGQTGGIIKVNSATGAQSALASPIQAFPLTIGANGVAHVVANVANVPRLCHLDLTTGATTPIPTATLSDPRGLATDWNGEVIVSDHSAVSILRVNPATGATTTISSHGSLMQPWGVAVEASGTLIVADNQHLLSCDPPPGTHSTCSGAVLRIDPISGAQSVVFQQGLFSDVTGVDIYRGPTTTATQRATWGQIKAIYR